MSDLKSVSPVLSALIKAKSSFGAIVKDRTNPFHKSKYATLDSINKAVDGALLENGLVTVHRLERCEDGKLYVTSRLLHESGEFDSSWQQSTCPVADTTKSQELGSAITYARRYNKIALLDVVADEDDDGNASTVITSPQQNNLVSLATRHGWSNAEVKELIQGYGFKSSSDLSLSAYQQICEELQKRSKSEDE
jgi:hypothetical protein